MRGNLETEKGRGGGEGDRFDEWQLIGERLECPVISPVAFHFNQFAWPKPKPVISTRP